MIVERKNNLKKNKIGHLKIKNYKIGRVENFKYSVIQKDGLNFVHLYFLNYTWYVNDLHNI